MSCQVGDVDGLPQLVLLVLFDAAFSATHVATLRVSDCGIFEGIFSTSVHHFRSGNRFYS